MKANSIRKKKQICTLEHILTAQERILTLITFTEIIICISRCETSHSWLFMFIMILGSWPLV